MSAPPAKLVEESAVSAVEGTRSEQTISKTPDGYFRDRGAVSKRRYGYNISGRYTHTYRHTAETHTCSDRLQTVCTTIKVSLVST